MGTQLEALHVTLEDQAAQRYLKVPFQVPRGAASVEVRLIVKQPDAVIDLGCEGLDGWRGWSGGARDSFVLTPEAATPGYLPGPIDEGLWSVVLGLHALPAEGADIEVEVHIPATREPEAEPQAPVADTRRGSARGLPAPAGLTWFAGDFHTHTVHSDGTLSVDELAARAASCGLDFVAVTDHNTVSHHAVLPASAARHAIGLIPGQEVTTHRGHANCIGAMPWIDFRQRPSAWLETAFDAAGVMSVNHPVDGDCSWQHQLSIVPLALELWHASWFRDLASTAPWAFLNRWGREIIPLGGSDFHTPDEGYQPGTPTTWVLAAEPTPEALVEAVRAGRTAISIGVRPDASVDPFGSPVLLRLGDELVIQAADGAVLVDIEGRRRVVIGDDVRVPASWGRPPYHLEDHRRWVLAISR